MRIDCASCRYIPWFFSKLQATVKACTANMPGVDVTAVLDVLQQCEHKVDLYQAHTARIVCQNVARDKVLEAMRLRCLATKRDGTEAACVADFKVKFNAKSRAMTVVQRGMGWHGWHIVFYTYVEADDGHGNMVGHAVQQSYFYDQIIKG